MAELNDSIDPLMEDDYWMDVAAIAGGYGASMVLNTAVEDSVPFDVPNEAYGVAVGAGSFYALDGDMAKMGAAGGGVYVLDSLAQRAGVKEKITNMGGS